ncbi:type I phosphomannose isomerase catalytic subunit [Silvibacterium bohemicum]|uniref:type I phosphomannose isomerase catalytic subunit n=2 Tax=Silvibacterium bohemicum TaxID=1577686 RepID=UPI0006796B91
MTEMSLYPLRFEPIYQYRLWGGRRLASLLSAPLPDDGPIGEAWILSDRDDHPSKIANGPLQGQTIGRVMQQSQEQLMGKLARRFQRFPLLLKFLDAHEMLSVQVHPGYARAYPPAADGTAKTEAWVVLESGEESRIYAGLKPHTTADILRQSVTNGTLADHLVSIVPKPGDGVFIPAGTVHSLGGDVVVFEVQQNSDTTFRLYDWGHVDTKTGQPRELEVDQALACIDFLDGAAGLVTPVVETETPVERERLFHCDPFWLWRLRGELPFAVGAVDVPRVLVCTEGTGQIEHRGETYAVRKGEVWLLPAAVGACTFRPSGTVNLLEIAIPPKPESSQDSKS